MSSLSTCKKVAILLIVSQIVVIAIVYHGRLLMLSSTLSNAGTLIHSNTSSSATGADLHLSGVKPTASVHQLSAPANFSGSSAGQQGRVSIAIGLAITTRKLGSLTDRTLRRMPFFRSLMVTFCKTAGPSYDYHFFLAYDHSDPYLSRTAFAEAFRTAFADFAASRCPRSSTYAVHLVRCPYAGKPAWSQNDAMIQAYLEGVQYFYRINDDTSMTSDGWTARFVGTLAAFSPPRVGVVGPMHKGGNTAILTYDFTHRRHVDIHGFYYPREFPDWYADRWITTVYKPGRSVKLPDVRLVHTMESGQRYRTTKKTGAEISKQVAQGQETVLRYIKADEAGFKRPDPSKVIAIALHDSSSSHTWGAIRNAQLIPVIYPGWTLQVYTSPDLIAKGRQDEAGAKISRRVISSIELLGARVVYVDLERKLPPPLWSYLAADQPEVDVFLVRDATARLTERERAAVEHWLSSRDARGVHCMRDHETHSNCTLTDRLWGARTGQLRSLLGDESVKAFMENQLRSINGTETDHFDYLTRMFYERLRKDIVCYDGLSPSGAFSIPFPVKRESSAYVGQKYDAHEQPVGKK